MIYRLLLPCLTALWTLTCTAQTSDTQFYPITPGSAISKSPDLVTVMPPIVTDGHVVAWAKTGHGKKMEYTAEVIDRGTKKVVHTGTIPLPDKVSRVEDVMAMGEDACIIYRVHDNKKYEVTLYALRVKLPGLEAVGEPINLAYYDFPDNSNPSLSDYWYRLAESPDGRHFAIMLSKFYRDKKDQEYVIWMKDAELGAVWEHTFQLPAGKAENVSSNGFVVSNSGSAFATFTYMERRGNEQQGYKTFYNLDQPSLVARIDASGIAMEPLAPTANSTIYHPMILLHDDGILIVGFGGELVKKARTKLTTWHLDEGLKPRSEPVSHVDPGAGMEEVSFLLPVKAGSSLVTIMKGHNELAIYAGDATAMKVVKRIPYADLMSTLELYGTPEGAVGIFYDLPKNVEGMESGGSMRYVGYYKMEPATLAIPLEGKVRTRSLMTSQDASRDAIKVPPRIGLSWKSRGVFADYVHSKPFGVVVYSVK